MAPRASALKVEHVGMRFGGLVALSDMNFSVDEGEIVSLIGPNGAGKTTAFNIVTGFLAPTHGGVSYRGTPLNGLKPHEIADHRARSARSSAPASFPTTRCTTIC